MFLDDLPLVFVSRLEVAPRFHSAEEILIDYINVQFASSKVVNLNLQSPYFCRWLQRIFQGTSRYF